MERVAITPMPTAGIQHLEELGVHNVQLVRVDTNHGSILFVQLFDFENVPPTMDEIVVDFIPMQCEMNSGRIVRMETAMAWD